MATPYASDAEVERIASRFLDLSLPASEWTHAAHFAAALVLLRDSSHDALAEMPALIRRYNLACGKQNSDTAGYHETITLASVRAGRAWLTAHPELPLHAALNTLLASPYGKPDWLLSYWSRERLFSVAARRAWLAPDVRELPF